MGLLFEQKEQWSEALSWYEQGQHHLKEMESAFRAKIGEMLLKQQEYVEAEKQLFETLRDDPGSQAVVTPLENLAEVYYQQQKNLSEAQRVYGSIKQIKEQANDYSYEAPYQNLLGNASYYFGDYRSAQNAYETAIEASPDDGILYSNLSQAWENIKEPGNRLVALENAVLALRKALELSPGAADFASRLENLEFQYRMARRLGESAFALSPTMSVLQVGVALDLVSYLVEGAESGELSKAVQEQVDGLRKRMRENVGLILPGINFKDIPGAGEGQYTLYLSDTPLVGGVLPQGRRFSPHSAEELAPLSVAPLEDDDPVIGGKGCWVAAADWASIEARGLTLWQIMEYPLRHLEALLKSDPSVLIDHQQAMWWLDVAKTDKAKTIKESPEKRSSLLHVLRALTHESVPVTAVDLICDTFLEGKMAGASLVSIAELLRSKPEIRPTLAGNNEQYTFYHLSADLEAELARLFHKDEAQPLLIMEIAQFQELMGTLAQVTFPPHSALLVETAELRPFVRKIIETSFPKIPVLSVQELLPGLERNIANTKEAQPVVVDGAGASSDAESEIVAVNIENSSQKESASHE
jgi:tetratricopeptide (TPR) repeat protein